MTHRRDKTLNCPTKATPRMRPMLTSAALRMRRSSSAGRSMARDW